MPKKPQKNSEPKQWGKNYQKKKKQQNNCLENIHKKETSCVPKKKGRRREKKKPKSERKRKPIQLQKINSRENINEEIKNTKTIRESIEGDRNTDTQNPRDVNNPDLF